MDNAFDQLQEEFITCCFERRPQEASYLGFTEYDAKMPSGSLYDRKKEIEQDKNFLKRFQDFSEKSLDFDQRITRKLAIHKLRIWLFVDETLSHYIMDPNAAHEAASCLNSLFLREGPEKFYPILTRLRKIPSYIEDFKTRVKSPARLWTMMAEEGAKGLLEFLPLIVAACKKESPLIAEEVEDAAKSVEKSLLIYIKFLEQILPTANTSWVMGRENFEKLLSLRKLPYTGDEILALGHKWLNEEETRLQNLSKTIAPGKPVEEVVSIIKSNYPTTFEKILELYKTHIEASREFVMKANIITMPEGEALKVKETPQYIRYQLPIAAYQAAPAVGSRTGYYLVTPPETEELFREHNEQAVANISVHEAYPGHHTQIFCSNSHSHKVRWAFTPTDVYSKVVSEGTELVEGWAHYCEEYMVDKGFNTSPNYQFVQSLWARFRAARIIVDVNLSRGDMSFDSAVHFLEKETGMQHNAAVAEVKRYTLGPTYPLSYLLGKHLVKNLKEKVKKKMGSKFTDRFFHDTLLYEGTMPIALLEEVFEHKISSM